VGSLLSSIYVGKTEFEVVDRVNTVTKLRDPSNGNNFLKSRLTIEQLRKTLCQGVQQTELNWTGTHSMSKCERFCYNCDELPDFI